MSEEEQSAMSTIGRRTGVELGLMITIIASVAIGTFTFANVRRDISDISEDLSILTRLVEQGVQDRFTANDMRRWSKSLSEKNPDLKMPDLDFILETEP